VPTIFDNLTAESQLGVALRQYFEQSYATVDVATGLSQLWFRTTPAASEVERLR